MSRRALAAVAKLRDERSPLVANGKTVVRQDGDVWWWTWAGARANASLASALPAVVDPDLRYDNFRIRLRADTTLESSWEVAGRGRTLEEVAPDVDDGATRGLKFSEILPAELATRTVSDRLADRTIGYLPRNPMTGVALPRVVVRKEYVYLSRQELDALAEAAGGPQGRDGLMVLVMGLCGLRWGELTGLRVQRVDGARARIMVFETAVTIGGHVTLGTPKSHEIRSVPVPPSLMASLATWIEGRERDALVFSDRKGGPIRDGNWARDALRPAPKKVLEVPKLTAHDLRHTCACLLIRAGAPVKAVQEIMGHASPTVTLNVYSHLWPDDLDRWAAALDGHLTDMGITEDPR